MIIKPGTDIGRYHILEQLGEGGMAVVYKAYDTRLENEVAIKVIRTGSLPPDSLPRILKRFRIEAKKMARMTHPNIVKVMDYGEFNNSPYLVMPYLSGGTLKNKLGKPLPWQETIKILIPITDALTYAHEQGLIHRDIKPSNILITQSGQPMLSDFGVAKVLESNETLDLTGTGMGVGTPEYMAPEQGLSKPIDQRVDIYALGVVFYEMVIGRTPFQADTPLAVLLKSSSEPLPRPISHIPDLPESVEHVILKALAKKPEDRFRNMHEFSNVLEKLAQECKVSIGRVAETIGPKKLSPILIGLFSGIVILIIGTLTVWKLINMGLPNSSPLASLASATPMRTSSLIKTTDSTTRGKLPAATTNPNVVYAWEYDTPGDLEGWGRDHYRYNDIESIQVANGFLNFNSFGSDPYINSPCCLTIQANETPIFEIRMKISATGYPDGEIYFITRTDENWNEAKVIRFKVYVDDNFHIYLISMVGNSNWKEIVTAFRIDPTNYGPAEIQIDYIRVRSP